MALAAIGSPDIAERITEASALELKLAGINWAYSPVGDVNSNPRNPIIGSFLSTCHPIASSYISPLQVYGLLATVYPTHFQRQNVVLNICIC
jgi:beta-glucosidase-like glycosyl hydrolase